MKKIVLILLVVTFVGCVAEREGQPPIETEKVLHCPEIVEQTVVNLQKLKVEPLMIEVWKKNVLSEKLQPCGACQQLNVAAYILTDEKGIYKPAILEYIKNMGKKDPNAPVVVDKPYIDSTNDNTKVGKNELADQYMSAIEDLQNFLSTEIQLPYLDAKNFVLDNYFIPLLKEEQKIQDVNQP